MPQQTHKAWAVLVTGAGLAAAPAAPTTRPTTRAAEVSPVPPRAMTVGTDRREPVLPPPLPTQPTQPTRPAPTTPTQPVPARPAAATQPLAAFPSTQPLPVPDAVSYWGGYVAGRRLHQRLSSDGGGPDDMMVLKGVIDGLADRDPAFAHGDVQTAFDQVQANVRQRRAERRYAEEPAFRRLADEDQERSRALLARNAERVNVESRPDGVQVLLVHPGPPGSRPVAAARTVTANLSVSLADGTLLAATDAAAPAHVDLGAALPALASAIRQMRVGERWQVLLPPDKAYGLAGNPPMIGPNQALAYDVGVVDVR